MVQIDIMIKLRISIDTIFFNIDMNIKNVRKTIMNTNIYCTQNLMSVKLPLTGITTSLNKKVELILVQTVRSVVHMVETAAALSLWCTSLHTDVTYIDLISYKTISPLLKRFLSLYIDSELLSSTSFKTNSICFSICPNFRQF